MRVGNEWQLEHAAGTVTTQQSLQVTSSTITFTKPGPNRPSSEPPKVPQTSILVRNVSDSISKEGAEIEHIFFPEVVSLANTPLSDLSQALGITSSYYSAIMNPLSEKAADMYFAEIWKGRVLSAAEKVAKIRADDEIWHEINGLLFILIVDAIKNGVGPIEENVRITPAHYNRKYLDLFFDGAPPFHSCTRIVESEKIDAGFRDDWAEIYKAQKIKIAQSVLNEYEEWEKSPCGYEGLDPGRCSGLAALFSKPKPPEDLIKTNGATAAFDDWDTLVAGVGLGATAVGVYIGATTTAVYLLASGTYLFSSGGAAAAISAGGIAGASSLAAGPVAIVVAAVIIGTMEGIAVFEAEEVKPELEKTLVSAKSDAVNILTVVNDEDDVSLFFIAFTGYMNKSGNL